LAGIALRGNVAVQTRQSPQARLGVSPRQVTGFVDCPTCLTDRPRITRPPDLKEFSMSGRNRITSRVIRSEASIPDVSILAEAPISAATLNPSSFPAPVWLIADSLGGIACAWSRTAPLPTARNSLAGIS
jgi:hypothetical protein